MKTSTCESWGKNKARRDAELFVICFLDDVAVVVLVLRSYASYCD